MSPAVAEKTPANRKFTKGERRKLRGAIRRLSKDWHTYSKMVPILVADGFTGPGGGTLKPHHLGNVVRMGGLSKKRGKKNSAKRQPRQAPAAPSSEIGDKEALIDLVLSAKLSDAKKIALIKNLRAGGDS